MRLRKLKFVSTLDVHKKLAELVKIHETLIRLSESLEKIYRISIFFNFFGSSIILCLIGFQFSIEINPEMLAKYFLFMTVSFVQILILCFYGNKLTTASESVNDAVYDTGWDVKGDKLFKSYLLMMMQRSQKPSTLSAFKFAVVSLKSFTTVSKLKVNNITK